MYTIGQLAKQCNISRSTILYYDKLGLIKPSKRDDNNYRLYSDEEAERLERLIGYRKLGIPLSRLGYLMQQGDSAVSGILMTRLKGIQKEMDLLKQQENLILKVLRQRVSTAKDSRFTKESWTDLLKQLGYQEEDWISWHREFQMDNPKEHRAFLKGLKMTDKEIEELLHNIR